MMYNRSELVDYLVESRDLTKPRLIQAFSKIDRADFVQPGDESVAYYNQPLPIGYEQTISQPTMVAVMLELLDPQPGERILDIGAGSGWTTALLAECVQQNGTVLGVELIPELVKFGNANLAKYKFPNAQIIQAEDGVIGLPGIKPPFDRILVSAAAENLPDELLAQFTKRLVLPIQNTVWVIDKDSRGRIKKRMCCGARFVPLVK